MHLCFLLAINCMSWITVNYKTHFRHVRSLSIIYLWVLLTCFHFKEISNPTIKYVVIDRLILVVSAKYILSQIYSHCIWNCSFWYFLEVAETLVFWRKYLQSLLIYLCFLYPGTSNFHYAGMVGCRKLLDPSMNNIFDVLLIGLQYTLSFKWIIKKI